MRRVINSSQGMGHGMSNSETNIRKSHACNILCQSHAFPAFFFIIDRTAQRFSDHFNGFDMEHIGHFPGCLCCISFNGMRQRIHSGGCRQALRHRRHHIRVDYSNDRHIMWIHTDKFTFLFHIRDDIINRYLCCCSCGCRHRNDRYGRIFSFCNTFQTPHIAKLRICNDNTDGLCRIHGRTAANGDNIIGFRFFKGFHTVFYIFNGRIGFNIRINFIYQRSILQHLCHFACHTELNQIRV